MSSTNPESWRVLVGNPDLVPEDIANRLDVLQECRPPRAGSSASTMIFRNWLRQCVEVQLIDEEESNTYFVALQTAYLQHLRSQAA